MTAIDLLELGLHVLTIAMLYQYGRTVRRLQRRPTIDLIQRVLNDRAARN